jgi:hypothetical protein
MYLVSRLYSLRLYWNSKGNFMLAAAAEVSKQKRSSKKRHYRCRKRCSQIVIRFYEILAITNIVAVVAFTKVQIETNSNLEIKQGR